jgi:hypothetical protein
LFRVALGLGVVALVARVDDGAQPLVEFVDHLVRHADVA